MLSVAEDMETMDFSSLLRECKPCTLSESNPAGSSEVCKGPQGSSQMNRHLHYLDCADGLTHMCLCQNLPNDTFLINKLKSLINK